MHVTRRCKMLLFVSAVLLFTFIFALICIGIKGKKQCANSKHHEWTEKDDELAKKWAHPKPTRRILQYFLDLGLTGDAKRGKSHAAKYCQRCTDIATQLLEQEHRVPTSLHVAQEPANVSHTATPSSPGQSTCTPDQPTSEHSLSDDAVFGEFNNSKPNLEHQEPSSLHVAQETANVDSATPGPSTCTPASDQSTSEHSLLDHAVFVEFNSSKPYLTRCSPLPSPAAIHSSAPNQTSYKSGIITVPKVHLASVPYHSKSLSYGSKHLCGSHLPTYTVRPPPPLPPPPPPGWNVIHQEGQIIYHNFEFTTKDPIITKSLTVKENGTYFVRLFGRDISSQDPRFNQFGHRLNTVSIERMLKTLCATHLCKGYPDSDYHGLIRTWHSEKYDEHVFYDKLLYKGKLANFTLRSASCTGYSLGKGALCQQCSDYGNTLRPAKIRYMRSKKKQAERTRSESCVPIIHLSQIEAQNRAKKAATERKRLRQRIRRLQLKLQNEIMKKGSLIPPEQSEELLDIMKDHNKDISKSFPANSFGRLFWQEQMNAARAKSKTGHRWHPMMIKWALNLRLASGKAYRNMRGSNVLQLPHESTLREYLHWTAPKSKFTVEAVEQLCQEMKLEELKPNQKYVALIHDEMKIKSDLVFRKHTGELVGFTDLGDVQNSLRDFEAQMTNDTKPEQSLASHMFVIMVRGLFVNVTYPLAQFPTANTKSDEIFALCWRAIEILEMAGLKVLSITCDGASINRRFFDLHGEGYPEQRKPVHSSPNPYAEQKRDIYFMSDPPHLIKCVRNAWSHSYAHNNTRTLWNNGNISWKAIKDLYKKRTEAHGFFLAKLSMEHVELTPFSRMKVRLAAQVLSETIACALPESESVTREFVRIFDKFFDVLNVRSPHEGAWHNKPNMKPYRSLEDPRLQWLTVDFIKYLEDWEKAAMARPNFTKAQKNKMCIPQETVIGLKRSALAYTAAVEYLIQQGVDYVLTEHFNQDPLEQSFGNMRQMRGGNEAPNTQQFNENINAARLRSTEMLRNLGGNSRNQRPDQQVVDNTPLPKRRRFVKPKAK
ncbi:uncharacterized protein [Amphiura filiformis]|uniref:uncharacterized protein n=1 Tax=Amphiura filiformis TaxID=82378 RepID=UPI003B215C33